MALTDQPYLPLYVDDWMNNTKLKMCTPSAHGLMLSIMCIMHKEENYGKILLKQKFKQSENQVKNFALQIAKLSAFDFAEVELPLTELIEEGVLIMTKDELKCSRMIKDAEISLKRSKAGRSGGKNTQSKKKDSKAKPETEAKDFALANDKANAVNGIVIENVNESENVIVKGKESLREKPNKIIFPWDNEVFKAQWQHWKIYKQKEFKFKYKSIQSEQAALNGLADKSYGDQNTAISIIHQSMEHGWKGFFELKNKSNAKNNSQENSGASTELRRKTAERLGLVQPNKLSEPFS